MTAGVERGMYSHRIKFCVRRGLGISPTSSIGWPNGYPDALLAGIVAITFLYIIELKMAKARRFMQSYAIRGVHCSEGE